MTGDHPAGDARGPDLRGGCIRKRLGKSVDTSPINEVINEFMNQKIERNEALNGLRSLEPRPEESIGQLYQAASQMQLGCVSFPCQVANMAWDNMEGFLLPAVVEISAAAKSILRSAENSKVLAKMQRSCEAAMKLLEIAVRDEAAAARVIKEDVLRAIGDYLAMDTVFLDRSACWIYVSGINVVLGCLEHHREKASRSFARAVFKSSFVFSLERAAIYYDCCIMDSMILQSLLCRGFIQTCFLYAFCVCACVFSVSSSAMAGFGFLGQCGPAREALAKHGGRACSTSSTPIESSEGAPEE